MAMNSDFDREIRFDIVEEIGVITTHSTGWRKELNLVCWNGGTPKYDIRDWSPNHERMSRGITLHENEMRHIFDLMKRRRMAARTDRGSQITQDGNSVDTEQMLESKEISTNSTPSIDPETVGTVSATEGKSTADTI